MIIPQGVAAHAAIPKTFSRATKEIKCGINVLWLRTEDIAENIVELSELDAL